MLRQKIVSGVFTIFLVACQPTTLIATSTSTATPTATSLPTSTNVPTTTLPPPTNTPRPTTSGEISRDQVWKGEILVTGDLFISPTATLTIEPGTIVRFTAQKDDSIKGAPDRDAADYDIFPNDPPQIFNKMIEILILGDLIAQGTPDQPIIFTSDSPTPALNDWAAIIVGANGKLVLAYSIVEYNYNGIAIDYEKVDAIEIHHNIIRHIAACGLCTSGLEISSKEPIIIENNIFEDCNHEGIDTYGGQDLVIRNNLFVNNVVGIIANEGSTVQIEGNIFQGNKGAIGIINNSAPVIHGNNFFENEMNIGTHNSNLLVDAENNWFNSTDKAQVRKLIRGNIDYEPFATEPFDIEVGLPFLLQDN